MQLARPENLWALLALIPMIGAYLWWWRWKARLMDRLGDRSLLSEMAHTLSARRQVARATFAVLGTLLLCIAYAQPQWGQTHRPIKRTGVDVVFALDLSASMNAKDVAPNRLEAAKNEIETTLEVLRGDRVGLVVFTAVSFVQTPLTTDYGAIRFYLDKLQSGQMPVSGTSLGRAVVDGVELLTGKRVSGEDEEEDVKMRRAKNQIVVLITDGEDHESDPASAAKTANDNNIRLVTVGFGSKDGVKIPMYRPDGQLSGYKRDKQGNIVHTKLDADTLEQMATQTGGIYVNYDGENSVANALVDYINGLEKTEIETMMKERYRERFQFFALPGLILLLLSLFFGERKRTRSKSAAAAAIVLLILGSGCDRAFEDTLSEVDRGNAFIEAGKFEEALAAYQEAETQIPARPELHYNLGRAHLGLEQWDEAGSAFARALETTDLSLRFDAYNNLGLAHAGKEAWLEAWQTFQDGLILAARNPGVIDQARIDDTRHNLEVAWRRFYPPCAKLEDDKEDNDEPGNATQLEDPKVSGATLCGLDDDWYVVSAIPGSTVSVTATFTDLRDNPDEEIPFLPQAADLQIALFDETGKTVLSVDQGEDPVVQESRSATRTIARFEVDDTMTTVESAKLLLKVGAAEHREFKYDLNIESIPPCWALEEDLEDNDSPEQAKAPGAGSHQMHTCAADDDWFAVDVNALDSFFVDIQTSPDQQRERPAELQVEIFDPNETLVAEGEVEGEYLTAGVRDVPESGRYLVHVFGKTKDEQGPYKLDIYQFAPCPEGDDRLEENDEPSSASPLDKSQPVQRYLMACGQDPDFYRIDFSDQDEKKVGLGLARISTPRPGADPTDKPEFNFDLMSPSGDQILVESVEAEEQPAPPPTDDGEPAPPQLPVERILQSEVEGESALVRVMGDGEFYHLVQLNPSDGSSGDDQQDKQDQQNGDDKPEDSENKQDGEQGEQNDQSEQEDKGGDEEQPSPQGDDKEPKPKDGQEEQPSPGEQDREGRLEDILQALEATDDNFQMKKALENLPSTYNEKDW